MSYRVSKARRILESEGIGSLAISAAKNVLPHPLNCWFALAHREYTTMERFPMSMNRRLSLWQQGFLSQSDALYDLSSAEKSEFLTDYQRYVKTPPINGQWSIVVGNKLLFHDALHRFDEHLPALYGYLRSGRLHHVDADGTGTSDAAEWLINRLHTGERLVIKYLKGGGGSRVYIVQYNGGDYYVNDQPRTEREFIDEIATLEEYIVTAYVEQADYAEELFPKTPNTLRVLTMYDPEAGEPFIPTAVQRIGTDQSGGLDNWSQGGLSAKVDLRTGEMGPGIQFPYSGKLQEHATHPSTESQIDGVQVPGWDQITDRLLEIADSVSYIPYIGWDILVTGPGEFVIIEGNQNTDVDLLQVHKPLLTDERVRRFYKSHGVL